MFVCVKFNISFGTINIQTPKTTFQFERIQIQILGSQGFKLYFSVTKDFDNLKELMLKDCD